MTNRFINPPLSTHHRRRRFMQHATFIIQHCQSTCVTYEIYGSSCEHRADTRSGPTVQKAHQLQSENRKPYLIDNQCVEEIYLPRAAKVSFGPSKGIIRRLKKISLEPPKLSSVRPTPILRPERVYDPPRRHIHDGRESQQIVQIPRRSSKRLPGNAVGAGNGFSKTERISNRRSVSSWCSG